MYALHLYVEHALWIDLYTLFTLYEVRQCFFPYLLDFPQVVQEWTIIYEIIQQDQILWFPMPFTTDRIINQFGKLRI